MIAYASDLNLVILPIRSGAEAHEKLAAYFKTGLTRKIIVYLSVYFGDP